MNHTMKLQPGPFNKIKSGQKIIESRLYDDKRRQIHIGDTITFSRNPDLKESISVKVVGLLIYISFDLLMNDFPASNFGGNSKKELLDEIHRIYPESEVKQYGVLGIRIVLA